MKHLLALLALTWIASGQQNADETLVGLPQYGVILSGTPQEPILYNNSGKNIIYVIVKFDYAGGPSTYLWVRGRVVPGDSPEGIPPGGTRRIPEVPNGFVTMHFTNGPDRREPKTSTGASLDAVIFADGEFVGADRGRSFDRLAKQFAAEHELAVLVAAARNDPATREAAWVQVTRIHPGQSPAPRTTEPLTPEDSLKMDLAAMLYCTLQRQGEAAAYDAAEREMAVPKLWRAAQ